MKPITFHDANTILSGKNIGVLPAYTNGQLFITRWRPSLRERLSMLLFGSVWICLIGEKHSPLAITGGRGANFVLPPLGLRQVKVASDTPDEWEEKS